MTKVVWPEYITFNNWVGALIIDYPESQIPVLDRDEEWKEWGAALVGSGVFATNSVPSPFSIVAGVKKDSFDSWEEWAKVVYLIMNNIDNT